MRIVSQNVICANLYIKNELFSSINKGLLLLVGFCQDDNEQVVKKMVQKIINARVFVDENGLTNLSLNDIKGEILSVSQFTLYGNLKKGNRPSFVEVLNHTEAKKLYYLFNELLQRELQKEIKTGVFGADMQIELINDGPFTMIFDSQELIKK